MLWTQGSDPEDSNARVLNHDAHFFLFNVEYNRLKREKTTRDTVGSSEQEQA